MKQRGHQILIYGEVSRQKTSTLSFHASFFCDFQEREEDYDDDFTTTTPAEFLSGIAASWKPSILINSTFHPT
jgi:hypothetical protein